MKIVAISGGRDGSFGEPYEIKKFDEEIVKMTGKKNPNFLFISFAQTSIEDAKNYYNVINCNFSNLGCNCEHLQEKDLQNIDLVNKKINNAHIIYVGGGNTLRLMNILRKYKINEMLKFAGNKSAVLCGVSAGAICWNSYGSSDSRVFTKNPSQFIKVTGLGFIPALFCPHYNNVTRQEDLKRMMKTTQGIALAFDNCTALQIVNNEYKILKTKESAKAWRCFWNKGEYIKEELSYSGTMDELIKRTV